MSRIIRRAHRFTRRNINESGMDWLHGGLDLIGLIPGYGEIFDATNAIIYAKEGDWTNAALSLICVIPEIGDVFGKGGKIVIFLEKLISKGGKEAKLAEKILFHGPKIMEEVDKALKLYKDNKGLIKDSLEALKDSDNDKIKEYIVPNIDKVLNALKTVERSFDIVYKVKAKQAPEEEKAEQEREDDDIDKQEAAAIISECSRQMLSEQALRVIIRNEVRSIYRRAR